MDVLSRPAEEFENDRTVEQLWAMKAMEHAEIYFNLISSVDPRHLRLTPVDKLIYENFRSLFPDLDVSVIHENELKSPDSKEKWRHYCNTFKDLLDDFSFGTLLRADASKDYSEDNTILVTRIQFYAIELARNKEGVNDKIRKLFRGQNSCGIREEEQTEEGS